MGSRGSSGGSGAFLMFPEGEVTEESYPVLPIATQIALQ